DGSADPGDFDSSRFYTETVATTASAVNFSTTMFFYVENLTDDDLEAWFGFASDDSGSLYVNGQLILEHVGGRGRGGNNVLQNLATKPAILEVGPNLVQFSFNQGSGGSGARVAFYNSRCFSDAFATDEVRVTANPEGFESRDGLPSASRAIAAIDCDLTSSVALTVSVPDEAVDVELREELPDGFTGSNPSHGEFDAQGRVLTFSGALADGTVITYDVSDVAFGEAFCDSSINDGPILGVSTFRVDSCPTTCKELQPTGAVAEMIMLGPIDLGFAPGAQCDDNGVFETTDYITDGVTTEATIALGLGDEIAPDFGGLAGGIGVKATSNPAINPRGDEGILTTWVAQADENGLINFLDPANIGGETNYVQYAITYIESPLDFDVNAVLEVGTDDAVKVYMNGELVYALSVCRGVPAYGEGDRVPVVLQSGRNTIVVAITQGGGGAGVRVVLRDELDFPIDTGEFSTCRSTGDGPPPPPKDFFLRGDADSSLAINITDGIFILNFLFLGGATPGCLDSADADDSGSVNITDGIFLLNFLFLGGPTPPAPHPDCGRDPTVGDVADCITLPGCA
ncbi:MAG: hypothetical protein AAF517_09895, partial [Planctomycetota bacterium]